MILSTGFSMLIYITASSELDARFEVLETRLEDTEILPGSFDFDTIRDNQVREAQRNIIVVLFYTNLFILLLGGLGSYLFAKKMLKPIEDVHEAQLRFTSDASHELRTPLAIMKTELEVALRDSKTTKKDFRELATSNLEEVERLSRLATTLLKLARLEDILLDVETFDVCDVINHSIKSLGLSEKKVEIHGNHPIYLQANKASILELILILLDNANKYSPVNDVVHVYIKKRSGKISIHITNTGKGISQDELKRIFSRFYRSDASRTRTAIAGYGLGLSIAKKIVEVHHGELTATSGENQLTTLEIKLPAKQ